MKITCERCHSEPARVMMGTLAVETRRNVFSLPDKVVCRACYRWVRSQSTRRLPRLWSRETRVRFLELVLLRREDQRFKYLRKCDWCERNPSAHHGLLRAVGGDEFDYGLCPECVDSLSPPEEEMLSTEPELISDLLGQKREMWDREASFFLGDWAAAEATTRLKDPNPFLRKHAAERLAGKAAREALDALVDAGLIENVLDVREAIRDAVREAGEAGLDALRQAALSPDPAIGDRNLVRLTWLLDEKDPLLWEMVGRNLRARGAYARTYAMALLFELGLSLSPLPPGHALPLLDSALQAAGELGPEAIARKATDLRIALRG